MAHRLGHPLIPVLPAWVCPAPGPLYAVLMGYKESPVDEVRRRCTSRVRSLFAAFFTTHGPCVLAALGGPPQLVLPVPSTARPGPAPLVNALGTTAPDFLGAAALWAPSVLRRTSAPIGHMHPHPDGFTVLGSDVARVKGARALLLDDTYVTGARAQSAAIALRKAGAGATLIVPLGRLLRPDRSAAHAAFAAAAAAEEVEGAPPGAGHRRCGRCVLAPAWAQTAAGTG